MITFKDFQIKREEFKKRKEVYENKLRESLTTFVKLYTESLQLESNFFTDAYGREGKYVSILQHQGGNFDRAKVDLHKGINVNLITVIDPCDEDESEVSASINISLIEGRVSFAVSGMGFFDEQKFLNVEDDKSMMEVCEYIKAQILAKIEQKQVGELVDETVKLWD